MKHLFIAVAIAALLASCQAQQSGGSDQPVSDAPSPAAPSPSEAETQEPAAQADVQLAPPVDGVFQSPLPQGVVISQPHHARMDISVPNKNGDAGRRTEFEYLEGDAEQAMRAFADSMLAVGFASDEGPSSDKGIVRQSFKKAAYGAVFARAQELPSSKKVNDSARGFLVVAWPAQRGGERAQNSDGGNMPETQQR